MKTDKTRLPNDSEALKDIILQKEDEILHKEEIISEKEKENRRNKQRIELLEEEIKYWKAKLFGRKSEKSPPAEEQRGLFDECDLASDSGTKTEKSNPEEQGEEVGVAEHRRKKPGRKPLPASLPRKDIIYELTEEEKQCGCGCTMEKIGEEVIEKLEIIPETVMVHRHIRYKYACKECHGESKREEESEIKIAPPPVQVLPKSFATPTLLAYLFTNKFCDSLPFYRQEKRFARYGIDLCRATMSNWLIKVYDKYLKEYMEVLKEHLVKSGVIGIDETTVQVLVEPGKKARKLSYMWVYRGESEDKNVLIYRYEPSRSGSIPHEYLEGYSGIIQTDGYGGYNQLGRRKDIEHAGCWAHVRRKFVECMNNSSKAGTAHELVGLINQLYGIEREIRGKQLKPPDVVAERQKRSRPLLEKFKKTLDKKASYVLPQSLLGKAIHYALGEWDKLVVYLENGEVPIDNNQVENAIRPFVIGRKNWLFCGNRAGANAGASIYSIIETAKANGLEPYWYLRYLFTNLPFMKTLVDYEKIVPWKVTLDDLMSFDYSICT